jgi:hypothetical protein
MNQTSCRIYLTILCLASFIMVNSSFAVNPQPNVLFILVDDMGWSDLGCYGADLHETPRIDQLAAESVRFTNACAMSVCSPTRSTLMTGKHAARLHFTIWAEGAESGGAKNRKLREAPSIWNLPHTETTIAKHLHDAGYLTALIGKWHLGDWLHYPESHALARARGLVRASFNLWLDDQLGGGMWYSDKRDRKSLYQTALVLAALKIHELTGDEYFREQVLKCYTWMETHLLRDDGLYWCDCGAAGLFGQNRPKDIHEAGSVVFLGGNMAMSVIHARLFRATKDVKYRERALRTSAALLKQVTTTEGVFIDDRDAWTNGVFVGDWAREVLILPGADSGYRIALRKTADSIFSQARTSKSFLGGSWSGPAEGEGSVWWKKKSLPEQVMTSANTVNMIVAACIE